MNNGKIRISAYIRERYEFLDMKVEKGYPAPAQALSKGVMSSTKSVDTTQMKIAETLVNLLQKPRQILSQDFSLHFNTWESIQDIAREICKGSSVLEVCWLLDAKQMTGLATLWR